MTLDRSAKTAFGAVSEEYELGRPSYSEELVEDVVKYTGLNGADKIIDIGCGTGNALLPFAYRDFEILGVDLSEKLVSIAKSKITTYPLVSFKIGAFEELDLPSNYFDLAISGQAFHWLEPSIAYVKLADILKPKGSVALFWNFQQRERSEFLTNVKAVLEKYPQHKSDITYLKRPELKRLSSSGLFTEVREKAYFFEVEYSAVNYFNFISSFSWVHLLPLEEKIELFGNVKKVIDAFSWPLKIPFKCILVAAKKI